MTVIEKAVKWAINTANDNNHGYSQASRWGPDYDCSSFVITAYEQAGVPVREAGASYTGNMRAAFIACGFVDVSSQVGLSSGYGIQAGDVLLNYAAHTCLAIGDGKVANCRTDEGHPQSGDQGQEIRIQPFWSFPWNCCLRYKGSKEATPSSGSATQSNSKPNDTVSHNWKPETLKYGSRGTDVYVLQSVLIAKNFFTNNSIREIDGDFGAKTQAAVNNAKRFYGFLANGECDKQLWDKILRGG